MFPCWKNWHWHLSHKSFPALLLLLRCNPSIHHCLLLQSILKICCRQHTRRLQTRPQNFINFFFMLKPTSVSWMCNCMNNVLMKWGMLLTFYISLMTPVLEILGSNQEMLSVSSKTHYSGWTVSAWNTSKAIKHHLPHQRLRVSEFALRSDFMMVVHYGFMVGR